eukprot:gene20-3416_t
MRQVRCHTALAYKGNVELKPGRDELTSDLLFFNSDLLQLDTKSAQTFPVHLEPQRLHCIFQENW